MTETYDFLDKTVGYENNRPPPQKKSGLFLNTNNDD